MKWHLTALASLLLATTASAQSAGKPLNLKLPPGDLPAPASSTSTAGKPAPGVYYGDTSGRMGNTGEAAAAALTDCDDSTYNKPQVHGSVSTGVVTGNHIGTGTWNAGEVNITKALGSCDDPGGHISISIGADQGNFHGNGGRHGFGH